MSQSEENIQTLKAEKSSKIAEIDGQIAELRSKIADVKMQQDLAVNSVENNLIRAPFDGVVLEKYFDVGTVVPAGSPVFSFTSIEGVKIIASVDTEKFSVTKGEAVTIKTAANNGSFTGTVASVSPVKDPGTDKNPVEIKVTDQQLKAGDRIRVFFTSESSSGNILPTSAIVTKYSIPSVFVIHGDKVVLTPITILHTGENFISVG